LIGFCFNDLQQEYRGVMALSQQGRKGDKIMIYTKHSNNQRGAALMLSMIFIIVSAIMIGTALNTGRFYFRNAITDTYYQSSIHIAEAGPDEAAYQLSYGGGTWEGWDTSDNTRYVLHDTPMYNSTGKIIGYYNVVIDTTNNIDLTLPVTPESNFNVVSTAAVPDFDNPNREIRQVRVAMDAVSVFQLALFSHLTLSMNGNVGTDSYNSALGLYGGANIGQMGDVGSNHDIILKGNVDVSGSAGAVGVIDYGGASSISGNIEKISSVYLPPIDDLVNEVKASNDNNLCTHVDKKGNVSAGIDNQGRINHNGGTVIMQGGTTETPKRYYVSDIKLVGNADLKITGPIEIYTDGDLKLVGTAIENPNGVPGDFKIYTSGTSIQLGGTNDFWGVVYAPEAVIDLQGNFQMYGSLIGYDIFARGNPDFHYDEALGNLGIVAYFTPQAWRELFDKELIMGGVSSN
jgi:hypothetical protein